MDELNADPACTAFLVQQPTGLDEFAILARVDPAKDVDGLHPINLGWLVLGKPAPLPCTPTGVIELLRRYEVPIAGAHVVVIGRGITVGRPLALMLTRRSENATVTHLPHRYPRPRRRWSARPISSWRAAGSPGLVTAGDGEARRRRPRRRASAGSTARSRAMWPPDVAEVAGFVAPNPGGVGPMTRAMLLTNVIEAAERAALAMTVRRAVRARGAVRVGVVRSSCSASATCSWRRALAARGHRDGCGHGRRRRAARHAAQRHGRHAGRSQPAASTSLCYLALGLAMFGFGILVPQ